MPQIITQNHDNLHVSWQKELANVVTDPKELLSLLSIDSTLYQEHFSARRLFPVRVPRPFISKMTQGDFNDPLLTQVMAKQAEFDLVEGYSTDPLGEHVTVAEGLLHKYKHRVLMIVKSGCAVNCRYCFRRHFPYADNSPNKQRWQQALNYITAHPEINEVIFSGGDPLMANDLHLSWLIQKIEKIQHVTRLRIHTRLPVVIPSRITEQLVDTLANSRLRPVMVLHINHPNEIDETLQKALDPLISNRITLFNQSVLLRGINDDVAVLCNLSDKLFSVGILPYYLHVLDAVAGAAHFDVPETKAVDLAKKMMAILPGYLMPKLVRENSGETNKTPIDLS